MVGYVQANVVNQSTVTGRPITAGGSGVVVVGSPDISYLWKLDFNFTYQSTSYSDTIATGDFGTSWGQTAGVSVATAYGGVLVDMNVYDGGFSYDVDSILFAFSKKFSHSITKTSTISNDPNCPSDPWEMKGKTENGSAMNDSVQIPSTIYLNNGSNISYLTQITETYNGNVTGYDWTRGNVSGNGGCQTQSSYQTYVLNLVAPVIAVYNQNMSGTTIDFDGPPANPNSIMVSVGYDSETITYDPTMGAQYQNSSMSYHAFMQPVSALVNGVHRSGNELPKSFSLAQNYPDPFNPTTTIGYQLPKDSHVILKVYDVLGREVQTLVDAQESAGSHLVTFDGTRVASGVYYYRMEAGSFSAMRKFVLMK